MRRPHTLAILTAFLLGFGLLPVPAAPNLVLILVDDLGYGDLSSYGASDLQTPRIDGLVNGGVRFENFYANCPVCSPTRAAVLTGRYPDLVGVPGVIRTHVEDSWGYLDPSVPLLPAMLRRAGYHTAIVGKWHLGLESPNLPNDRGFHFFHGFLGDMMDDYRHHRRNGLNFMRRNHEVIDPEGHATDLFTQWAIDYLESRQKLEAPFFLYLAYNAPHTPIQPPEIWMERVQRREPQLDERRARLVALIEHLDASIGKVLDALQRLGMEDNTLVVFTSDNGGQLAVGARCAPWRGGKQDMYEGGLRVPMAAYWPGHIKPETTSRQSALTMDLFPTLCAAAGISVDHKIDGSNLLPSFTGHPQPELNDRTLFWMRREGNRRYQGQDYFAVRRGPWKLLHNNPFKPLELYNLDTDPGEQRDVAQNHPGEFNDLARRLRHHIQQAGQIPWQSP